MPKFQDGRGHPLDLSSACRLARAFAGLDVPLWRVMALLAISAPRCKLWAAEDKPAVGLNSYAVLHRLVSALRAESCTSALASGRL